MLSRGQSEGGTRHRNLTSRFISYPLTFSEGGPSQASYDSCERTPPRRGDTVAGPIGHGPEDRTRSGGPRSPVAAALQRSIPGLWNGREGEGGARRVVSGHVSMGARDPSIQGTLPIPRALQEIQDGWRNRSSNRKQRQRPREEHGLSSSSQMGSSSSTSTNGHRHAMDPKMPLGLGTPPVTDMVSSTLMPAATGAPTRAEGAGAGEVVAEAALDDDDKVSQDGTGVDREAQGQVVAVGVGENGNEGRTGRDTSGHHISEDESE